VRELETAHRPVHGRQTDAQAALLAQTLAQLCERQVVLLLNEARDEGQRVRVEQGLSAAGVSCGSEFTRRALPSPHLLDEGEAHAELAGELTLRACALVVSSRDLDA
jgi:hypothetical protein